jgi:hypothetical protein
MFSENKKGTNIELAQHEQLEYAQARIRQKKNLYRHFVLFLIGSVFLFLLNKVLKYGETYDWAQWVILVWLFLWVVHAVNVFVFNEFMGRDWERAQREKLVGKQQQKISQIEKEYEKTSVDDLTSKKKDE